MKMTIAEFAVAQGTTSHIANGVVNFLVEKGLATKTDEKRPLMDAEGKPKRGRPSDIYEIPESVTIDFA